MCCRAVYIHRCGLRSNAMSVELRWFLTKDTRSARANSVPLDNRPSEQPSIATPVPRRPPRSAMASNLELAGDRLSPDVNLSVQAAWSELTILFSICHHRSPNAETLSDSHQISLLHLYLHLQHILRLYQAHLHQPLRHDDLQ